MPTVIERLEDVNDHIDYLVKWIIIVHDGHYPRSHDPAGHHAVLL